jgi:hypothetical protein
LVDIGIASLYDRHLVRRSPVLAALLCALTLVFGAPLVAAQVSNRAIGNPVIDKIIFGGTPTNPGITITGSDLTYDQYLSSAAPPPDPSYAPGGHPGCPVQFKGNQGYDYGTRLYFVDKSAKPLWAAGRYRPRLGELDCIGLIVTQWTSGSIQYHFGSFFRLRHFQLDKGDFVQLVFNHLTTGVHVSYTPGGVAPGS